MKLKSIFLTGIFSLFLVSGLWAQSGERVYIRQFAIYNTGKTSVVIYEKGESQQMEIENLFGKKSESLKSFAEILEKYFKLGYKVVATTTNSTFGLTEYILEKQ